MSITSLWSFAAGTNDSSWPIYHGDSALRGIADCTLPDKLSVFWRFKVGSPVSVAPVVGGGRIFFISDTGEAYAVNMQGVKVWSTPVSREPAAKNNTGGQAERFSTQPVFVDGTVVVGSDAGNLFALEAATGAIRWKYEVGAMIATANWIGPEEGRGSSVVVMSQYDSVVHRIDLKTGSRIWASKPMMQCDGAPGLSRDFVVFGGCDTVLHILSTGKGEEVGRIPLGEDGHVAGSVAIDGNLVFTGTGAGVAVCATIGKERGIVWTNQVAGRELFATPAVTKDRVVIGSKEGKVVCLNRADGKKLWSCKIDDAPSSPIVAGDKVVFSCGGTLFILKLEDGGKLNVENLGDYISPPAVVDGRVIVGTDDGFLIMYGGKP